MPDSRLTMNWTLPLQISISLGAPEPATIPGSRSPAVAIPGRKIKPAAVTDSSLTEATGSFSAASLNVNAFGWPTALSLALASQLSYENAAAVRATALNQWGLQGCEFIEADDTQCFVAWSDRAAMVAFRGSEAFGDWLANLNIVSTTRSYGTVHRGFLGAFQVVEAGLLAVLDRLAGRSVLLTGHSLGGALATVAAAEWSGRVPISWIYTYGQPAVGRGDFPSFMQQQYRSKFFRFVNDDDIVPRVPPGYRHVGALLHFDGDGDLESAVEAATNTVPGSAVPAPVSEESAPMLTETEFDALRSQLLQQRVQARESGAESIEAAQLEGLFPSFSDHAIARYIAKIAAKV